MRWTIPIIALALSLSLAAEGHEPEEWAHGLHTLPVVAPGERGMVRLANRTRRSVNVVMHGVDDDGERSGPVSIRLGPLDARQISAAALETGERNDLDGSLGDGRGFWRLEIRARWDIDAFSFHRGSGGLLSALPAAETHPAPGVWERVTRASNGTPLFGFRNRSHRTPGRWTHLWVSMRIDGDVRHTHWVNPPAAELQPRVSGVWRGRWESHSGTGLNDRDDGQVEVKLIIRGGDVRANVTYHGVDGIGTVTSPEFSVADGRFEPSVTLRGTDGVDYRFAGKVQFGGEEQRGVVGYVRGLRFESVFYGDRRD